MILNFQNQIKDIELKDAIKDKFYFSQMNEILEDLISFNKRHEELSELKNVLCEEHIIYEEGNLKFHGFIDKLLYVEIDGEIYAAIMDYKTGKDYITLDNVEDGFHLQLPSYMYLVSHALVILYKKNEKSNRFLELMCTGTRGQSIGKMRVLQREMPEFHVEREAQ